MERRFNSLQPVTDLPQVIAMFAARRSKEGDKGAWYSIVNASQTEAEIFIYDEIGFWGVTAGDFINDLRDIKASTITLRINSPGGDVFDGVAIFNAVKRHPATVDVFVDGIAASAASFIAMAGDTVTMSAHSQMMIHEASGLVIGPAEDMRKMADILDKSSDNIAAIYAEKAGGTVPEWRGRMRDETWMSDREAVELGLADSVEGEEAEVEDHVEPSVTAVFPDTFDAEMSAPEAEIIAERPRVIDFRKVLADIAEENADELYAAGVGGN